MAGRSRARQRALDSLRSDLYRFKRVRCDAFVQDLRTMLQLSDVRVFLEIVSTGSFTSAANALGMPKSSVARQMARLEDMVGCRLIDRTSRVVALTEDGRAFVPHARRLLDDGVEAQNILRQKGGGASGLLTITTTPLLGAAFLAPHLGAFRALHPRVKISMLLSAKRVEIGSGPGEADIALRLRSEAQPNIGSRKLGEIDFRLVAAPTYLQGKPMLREPADLGDHTYVELGPQGKDHRIELVRGSESRAVQYNPALHVDDPQTALAAIVGGAGVGSLPAFLVASALQTGALVRVLPGWGQAPVPLSVLYRTEVSPPVRVRAYLDFLVETLGREQPWRVSDA